MDEGAVADQAFLLLAAEDRGLVAVPEEEVTSSGVLDWCSTLPGWDFQHLAAAQAAVGPDYRTVSKRQAR